MRGGFESLCVFLFAGALPAFILGFKLGLGNKK